jgi:hypothetical protein
MPQFITRIELHGAKGEDYNRLHIAMAGRGFSREIRASNGPVYLLPTADYIRDGGELTSHIVYIDAWGAASSVSARFSVLVVEAAQPLTFSGLEPASA